MQNVHMRNVLIKVLYTGRNTNLRLRHGKKQIYEKKNVVLLWRREQPLPN